MAEVDPKTTADNKKDPELVAAEREASLAKARKDKAEAEKSIAEAQRDKLKAELSPLGDQSKITPPTGDVTTDQAGFIETQMLAQEAARKIARRLAHELHNPIRTLIIYSGSEITSLATLALVLDQLEAFHTEYELKENEVRQALSEAERRLENPDHSSPQSDLLTTATIAPSIATGVVRSVAELANLFRTTTEFKNKAVSVPEDMIVSYLVKSLSELTKEENKSGAGISVYYPAYFPANITPPADDATLVETMSGIGKNRLAALGNIRNIEEMVRRLTNADTATQSESQAKKLELTTNKAALSGLATADPQHAVLKGEIEQLEAAIEKLDSRVMQYQSTLATLNDLKVRLQLLDAAAEQVTLNLNTPDTSTKVTPMSQLIRAERFVSIMKGEGALILRLNVTANGTTMIKKNLFLNARVRHSAGVSVVYQLFDKTGRIVQADGMQYYYGWKSAEEVQLELAKRDPYQWNV